MKVKLLLSTSIFALPMLFACGNAAAAGYFGSTSKESFDGWACNPQLPNYEGWIHFWRDDNKFLGAVQANIQREDAVGNICNDIGRHGFNASFAYPVELLDNKWHTVRAYFINPDNTNFELQNSVQVLFDGGPVTPPPPPPPNPPVQRTCSPINQPGWVMTGFGPRQYTVCYTPGVINPSEYTYTYVAELPVGHEIEVCNTQNLPAGWQQVASYIGSACMRYDWSWTSANVRRFKRMF
ncbi:hypothetical protein [Paracidovorax avenae]|uniref:hypothetical protein n=1 Tax=Paracidovorax avenae TaxID=80867 RepID=UPI0012603BD5|nr:hypothetical protein [Paracidovorax avenae]